ncbi:MAG: hypothetical protein EA405_03930 [Rhodospirillales bacterium]|nr:MAG: hypothetical protein EA405_03930 [Rhodospirillales bacterium]
MEVTVLLCGNRLGRSARNRDSPWRHDDGEAAPLSQGRIILRLVRDRVPPLGNMMTTLGVTLERQGRQLPVWNGASAYADRVLAGNPTEGPCSKASRR